MDDHDGCEDLVAEDKADRLCCLLDLAAGLLQASVWLPWQSAHGQAAPYFEMVC